MDTLIKNNCSKKGYPFYFVKDIYKERYILIDF